MLRRRGGNEFDFPFVRGAREERIEINGTRGRVAIDEEEKKERRGERGEAGERERRLGRIREKKNTGERGGRRNRDNTGKA